LKIHPQLIAEDFYLSVVTMFFPHFQEVKVKGAAM
jgi:hypothetical protein